jgi:hypothetical protein
MAYAVGLISLRAAQDLHLVRRIRNDFAHHPMVFSLGQKRSQVKLITLIFLRHLRMSMAMQYR